MEIDLYKELKNNQAEERKQEKENVLDRFEISNEIKNLENKIEEYEQKRKGILRLMFATPTMSLAMGFTLSIGVAVFSSLENLTIQNFLENFLAERNLYSFYVVPTVFGLYYSWAIGTTDYSEIKRILNITSLQCYFLKNKQANIKESKDLKIFLEKLVTYGEKMGKYLQKYKHGKWGIEEREKLSKDNIDPQTFENYLEEYSRKRKM